MTQEILVSQGESVKASSLIKKKVTQKSPLDRKGNKKEVSLLSAYLWILISSVLKWNSRARAGKALKKKIVWHIFVLFLQIETLPGICSERGMTDCAHAYRQVGRGMANLFALAPSEHWILLKVQGSSLQPAQNSLSLNIGRVKMKMMREKIKKVQKVWSMLIKTCCINPISSIWPVSNLLLP